MLRKFAFVNGDGEMEMRIKWNEFVMIFTTSN